ncbi:NADH-quinone oxidoreductase subunit A [Buchnera aphidicola (Cinara splendens)]|uniref:NADH-quinone oxidoreductase subunit n=2 Tax=Buchnera aphidicola TaxID=9 RepID=A0A451DE10_9GAMM|nr:NADH-quinone oxidoreductase subunit A [Buchnera aphidicola (Cinara splendens)]
MFMNINDQYVSFIYFIVFGLLMCISMLLFGYILGGRSYFYKIPHPFESGIISVGSARLRVPIKFSLLAILFVLFDAEILYLYTWSICVRELGWIGLLKICFFINTLFIALFYLVTNNIFEWIVSK